MTNEEHAVNTGAASKSASSRGGWAHRGAAWGRGRGGAGRGGGGRGRGRGGGSGSDRPRGEGPVPEGRAPHLGRYRDDILPDVLEGPGLSVTTVKDKERSAERELVDYLERVVDELYPETIEKPNTDDDVDGDMEKMLERELADMTVQGGDKSTRFRLCKHETPCVIHINFLGSIDPSRIAHHILSTVEKTARCPFKHVRRITPIAAVSQASLQLLGEIAKPVIEKGFATPDDRALKFAIHTNSRNSVKLDRMDIIHSTAQAISGMGKGHTVDLKNADRTVLVETYKGRIGLGVVEDFDRFRKYNPWELAAHVAKASIKQTTPEPIEPKRPTSPSLFSPKRNPKHLNRDAKAEKMAGSSVPVSEPSSKRKVEDLEEGEVKGGDVSEIMVEAGEGIAGLEDGVEEVISEGRVNKIRRVEEED